MAQEYAFDIVLQTVIRVQAESLAAAQQKVKIESQLWEDLDTPEVRVTEASSTWQFESDRPDTPLPFQIDGKDVEEAPRRTRHGYQQRQYKRRDY
jgi:hypothetical protein